MHAHHCMAGGGGGGGRVCVALAAHAEEREGQVGDKASKRKRSTEGCSALAPFFGGSLIFKMNREVRRDDKYRSAINIYVVFIYALYGSHYQIA